MKKELFFGLIQITFISMAWSANTIDLTINPHDLTHYKEKTEKYIFTDAQFKLNNDPTIRVEQMETRGQGSISYRRRNFGLKLEEQVTLGRITNNKLNLLSMGADPGYISTQLGLMTAELLNIGLPLPTEFVEVKLNGKSNGLYTLVEKPKAVLDKSPYVVRRGYKSRFITEEAEISKKLTQAQITEILKVGASIYQTLENKKGEELFNDLKQKMDIEAYMRWMIMNSLYMNGDFPDEIFFYVDADLYKQGRIYLRVLPWDFDDLFKPMHGVSINALEAKKSENKKSILYSYEDKLDRAFAPVNTYMYDQLKATARNILLNEISRQNTDKLLNDIGTRLSEYLDNSTLLKLSASDSGRKGVAYTKTEIQDLLTQRKKQIDERRTLLLERVTP